MTTILVIHPASLMILETISEVLGGKRIAQWVVLLVRTLHKKGSAILNYNHD